MNQGSNFDRLNLDKLVTSQTNYQHNINQTIAIILKDKNIEDALKKIILFCKYVLSVNGSQRKKFLCLHLIKDISQNVKSQYFEKTLDEHIPSKLMKTITSEIVSKQSNPPRNIEDDQQYSVRLVTLSIQTVCFWTRKLSHFSMKSSFNQVYQQIRKLRLPIPKNFQYYKIEKILNGMFGQKEEQEEQFVKNQEMTPLLSELHDKFNDCKGIITEKLNIALENDQELYLKEILEKIRDFLLLFFSRYKPLQDENSIDRDVLIVYFHIMNHLFKKIANRIYVPAYEMITMTKQIFEGSYSSDFSSIDRMDIVHLAGVHKYNALSIFQRIHQRIQDQQKKLAVCEVSMEQQQVRDRERQKERDRQALKKNSREKLNFSRIQDQKKFTKNTKPLQRK